MLKTLIIRAAAAVMQMPMTPDMFLEDYIIGTTPQEKFQAQGLAEDLRELAPQGGQFLPMRIGKTWLRH